jgi:RNA polymerase-binding transcription factor DksA
MDHETSPLPGSATAPASAPADASLDLDAIAADLADVEVALARLEAGTYFTDEVTGEPLPAEFLAANPTARTR